MYCSAHDAHAWSETMKRLIMTGAVVLAAGAINFGDALFWVVGERESGKCEIVTANPVVVGDTWFSDGPYKSMDDAKLARSTIRVCPLGPEEPADK
jgi:hypothetical protein